MKKWIYLLLLVMALFMTLITGVYAPVLALTYHDIYINFSENVVTDFDDYPLVLNQNTDALSVYGESLYWFNYKMSICPVGIPDKIILLVTNIYDSDGILIETVNYVITIPCKTTITGLTIYETIPYDLSLEQAQDIKETLTIDNAKFIRIANRIYDNYQNDIYSGIQLDFYNLQIENRFFYEFNTTYYLDTIAVAGASEYFLGSNATIYTAPTPTADSNIFLLVAYDSVDYYRLNNSDTTNSTSRPFIKYAIPIGQKITAYGIGAGTYARGEYQSAFYTKWPATANNITFGSRLYVLNYANEQQAFPGADTLPVWEYDSCNAWDIPCHLGNALVYLAKDAPITSDIYQIASSGWQFISNGFYAVTSLFGANFDENGNLLSGNAFGVLLLISLGILLISWGVSGDE